MNPTGTSASALAFSASEASTAAESTTGSVFGMARMAQYPPAAAAAVPDAIVSSSSRPGVRRCTCGSTNAGASTRPGFDAARLEARDHAVLDRDRRVPRRCPGQDRSRARPRSRGYPCRRCGSTASRHLHRGFGGDDDGPVREQVVEHRHAHDETGAHLRLDQRRPASRRRAGRSRRRGSSGRGASPSDRAAAARGSRPSAPCTRAGWARSSRPRACARAACAGRRRRRRSTIASMSAVVSQPIASIPRGISVGGPTSVTRAPHITSAWMSERATREWSTSPTIATCRPSIRPSSCCIVYRSSSACVGCWCLPSPALTTCAPVTAATSCGAPIGRVPDHDHVRA